jgi:ATP-dependent protease ClpP protease subunit
MQKIILNGDIGFEITLAEIMGIVKANADTEIEFIVSTYGGYVDEAFRIYDYLAKQNNVSVTFDQICASAGTFAFLSIPKEKRKATANTMFAIHLPYNSYFLESMDVQQLESEAENLNVVTESIKQVYEKELNMSREDIELLLAPESWFSSLSALGFELISEVVEIEDKETQNLIFDKSKAENRICAFVKKEINNQTQNKMSNEKTEIGEVKTMLGNFINKVENLFKAKALVIQTKEGTDIEVSGETLEVGATTNAPDGTYTATIEEVEKTIVIKDGKVESIEDVVVEETEEMKVLKAENEALKSEIETLKNSKNEIENKINELKELKSKAQDFLKKEVPPQPITELERRKEIKNKLKNK